MVRGCHVAVVSDGVGVPRRKNSPSGHLSLSSCEDGQYVVVHVSYVDVCVFLGGLFKT